MKQEMAFLSQMGLKNVILYVDDTAKKFAKIRREKIESPQDVW